MITYENSTKDITIEQCLQCQAVGMDVMVNDGNDVTFKIEFDDYDD
ncbi:hypothetical protein NSA27_02435 [Clostridium tepidum]|nr:hypothetical protein [Clostridium tepidum]MCR1933560.1 hypothetical protein [Clostridium tepidum]